MENIENEEEATQIIDYDAIRLENINKNEEFLESIGLGSRSNSVRRSSSSSANRSMSRQQSSSAGMIERLSSENGNGVNDDDDENVTSGVKRAANRRVKKDVEPFEDTAQLTEVRRSKRVRNIPAEAVTVADMLQLTNKDDAREYKRAHRNIDFNEELIENVQVDDDDDVRRSPITNARVRQLIDQINPDHSDMISDKELGHCVMRVQSMTNRALGNRLKMISRFAAWFPLSLFLILH